ncbi:MAG: DMT family transporter [Shimia sp.]
MTRNDTQAGILFMIGAMALFGIQDGISRHLAGEYNVLMVVMIRYWFFAAFVLTVTTRQAGSLRAAARTGQPKLQIARGLLLAAEICVMVLAFTVIGLVESLAIFTVYPLIVAALSGLVLGERVGPARWVAIGVGCLGVLLILRPGFGVFAPGSLIAVASMLMFAVYTLLTRLAARTDAAATSFFWTGTVGCAFMTVIGIWFWEPMIPRDWLWMGALCVTGALGHYLLIKTYELAEPSAVQPFALLQLPFASIIGIWVFGEVLELPVAIGAAIVVAAGLFTLFRERRASRRVAAPGAGMSRDD